MTFITSSKYFFIATVLVLMSACVAYSHQVHTEVEEDNLPGKNRISTHTPSHIGELKLLTLNVAHGRKEATNQIFVSKQRIQQNLVEIANAIVKQDADVVALQEADGPSRWSGSFDHVEYIATQASYPWYYRADNAHSWLFNYGTAILSRWPVSETVEYNFKPSPPTVNKGFLLIQMKWKPNPATDTEINIDIVSVHLDFSRQKIRDRQISEMSELLSTRNNPLIIMGDFNSNWFSDKSVVKRFAKKGKLKVYKPQADNLPTYSSNRLDWILISSELEFISYKVLPERLSDHLMVVAKIKLSNKSE